VQLQCHTCIVNHLSLLLLTCERDSRLAADDGAHVTDRRHALVDAFIGSVRQTVFDGSEGQRPVRQDDPIEPANTAVVLAARNKPT